MRTHSGNRYLDLFRQGGFHPFLWTQFLGALNDNVFKIAVSMLAVGAAAGSGGGSGYLTLVGAVFIVPFFLFSGWAGHLADRFDKRSVLIGTKALEIVAMGLGVFAFLSGRIEWLLAVLFLMALQSTLFSPAKYGILPEMLPDRDLSRANGLLEMTTFLAIILGTSLGGFLFSAWKDRLALLGLVLAGLAVAGTAASFGIARVPPSGAGQRFSWNPWREIGRGIRRLRGEKPLWLTVLGMAYFWFLGALLQMDLLLFGKQVMGLEDFQVSLLGAFLAVGIGAGSLLAGRLSGDKVELGLVPLGSIGMGMFSLLLARSGGSYAGAAFALALLGIAGGFFIVPLNALLQQKSGREEKGQLIATANFLQTGGILLASGALWTLHDALRVAADRIVLLSGLFTLGATVYVLRILPDSLVRFTLWLLTHTVYRIRIAGQARVPFRGPALLVCNHISHVDGLLVGACIQRFVRFLVYRPYYEHRALRWLFRLMKAIPVAATNRKEMLESLERARAELEAGHVVCIFSEGAISRTGNMLPFKRGFERIVEGLEIPIIPVHLDRLWGSIFSFQDGRFFWKWPRRIPYPVTVSFGNPLPSTAGAEEVRRAVMELGSEAASLRRAKGDLLHLKFIRSAKREWFRFCMADSTGRSLTFGNALVGALILSREIRKRCADREMVGVLLPASVGGALANVAALLAGKVPVNLNFTAGRDAMGSAIRRCEIRTILTSPKFLAKAGVERLPEMVDLGALAGRVRAARKASVAAVAFLLPARWIGRLFSPGKRDPRALATVIFSSGSTGDPKGVMLSHHNILSNIESIAQIFWVTREDRVMGVLPFFHSFGFTGTLWFPLVSRFGAVFHPNPMDARAVGEMVLRHKATILISTPTFYAAYLRRCSREEFASLRFAIAGAEKLRDGLAGEFREKYGINLLEGYGCTELAPVVSVNVPDYAGESGPQRGSAPGTVGHPIPGVTVKVVDSDTGSPLPSGTEGLLRVKGPNLMLGYLHEEERTAEVVRNGWYDTGDVASIDENGFLRITDRLSRFSKIGGEMVPHVKVEEEINRILGEPCCAVTGVPDEQKGERLVVLYTRGEPAAEKIWTELGKTDLPKLWIPKPESFFRVETIPVLGTGKTDLRQVRVLALQKIGTP